MAARKKTLRLIDRNERAIAKPRAQPVVPSSNPSGYSGTPLFKKLGVRDGSVLGLDGAPPGFESALEPWPERATLVREGAKPRDLTLWFVRSKADLTRGIASRVARAKDAGLWIVWPKLSSALRSDVSEADVRRVALDVGMVDFKVCAVDANWSGLRFTLKKPAAKPKR